MGLCQDMAAKYFADDYDTAQAVCMAESGGNPSAVGDGGDSIGLWQIDTAFHPDADPGQLTNPDYNAQYARKLYDQQGWHPWSTYNSGAYQRWLTGTSGGSASNNTDAPAAAPAAPSAADLSGAAILAGFLFVLLLVTA